MTSRYRILVILILSLLTAQFASAQDWAREKIEKSPRHHEWVTVKYDNRSVDAFVVYPETTGKAPVILVIHTIAGMIDWVEDAADQLAQLGYIAIAPDLLSGMGPNGGRSDSFPPGKANEAMSKLSKDQVTADLNASADYALKFPSANGELMEVGFCWGGNESFRFATNRPDLKAVYVFYGTPPPAADMARIKAPVFAFYGGADNRVTSTLVSAADNMKAAGKTFEPEIYDGAGHGFMQQGEDPNGTAPNKKAHDDAWVRLKGLLAKNQ